MSRRDAQTFGGNLIDEEAIGVTMTKQESAVIKAAIEWERTPAWGSADILAAHKLLKAVEKLLASRKGRKG